MYWFRMNIRDYEADTKGLDFRLHGVYFALMRLAYHTERPLPTNRKRLYGLVNAHKQADKDAVEAILTEFFHETDLGFIQPRIEREIIEYQKKVERNRANGSKGGRPSRAETQSVMTIANNPPVTGTEDDNFGNPVGSFVEPSGLSRGFRVGNPEESHTRTKNQNNRFTHASVVARARETVVNRSSSSLPNGSDDDAPRWLAGKGSPAVSPQDATWGSDIAGADDE